MVYWQGGLCRWNALTLDPPDTRQRTWSDFMPRGLIQTWNVVPFPLCSPQPSGKPASRRGRLKVPTRVSHPPTWRQIQGYGTLKTAADDVIKENVEVFALLIDLLDFKTAALDVLYAVFGQRGAFKVCAWSGITAKG